MKDKAEKKKLSWRETIRIAWKPYMHSLTLRDLLPGVVTPTLLVWGREDAITPPARAAEPASTRPTGAAAAAATPTA